MFFFGEMSKDRAEIILSRGTEQYSEAASLQEAFSAIGGLLRRHPEVQMHVDGDKAKSISRLESSDDLGQFGERWIDIFGDDSLHVLSRLQKDRERHLKAALTGHEVDDLSELEIDSQLAKRLQDTCMMGGEILDYLGDEFSKREEPLVLSVS